ncbi:hypothetical protein QBC46DRAFT_374957 [Diplogelasinospora grovesii]|uniref:DUF2423 domain-containing protein n=1 Tax=Diplogelasinospora grovesii TaxID=303347 RepID=A0AAN6NF34_9PEZI|nr:hypothetical protein QBC46DRAFT_374957 [Diplogelasinospora grovesii]
MAKSARSSTIKSNNQKLKKNVFGPVELARAERLSAKLLELAAQPKPQRDVEMKPVNEETTDESKDESAAKDDTMEVDSTSKPAAGDKQSAKKKIEKRRVKRSAIVFPKYGEKKGGIRKRK